MKTLILPLLWIAMFSGQAFTQISRLDEKELANLQNLNDHDRSDTLLNWSYDKPDKERSHPRALAALEYAVRAGYRKTQSGCFVKLGAIDAAAGRYPQATYWFTQALYIRDSLGLKREVASCYNNLGLIEKKLGNYDAAALLFRKGLQLLETDPSDGTAMQLHNNLGATIRYQGKLTEALEHLEQSMALGVKIKKPLNIAQARLNIANLLQDDLNLFEEAKDSLYRCLKDFTALKSEENIGKCHLALGNNAYYQGNFMEALTQYNGALALAASLEKADQGILLKNRGRVFFVQGNYKAALPDLQSSLDTFQAIGNLRETASTELEIGNFYNEQNQWNDAVPHYKKALNIDLQDQGLKTRLLFSLSQALERSGQKQEANIITAKYMEASSQLDPGQIREVFAQYIRSELNTAQGRIRSAEVGKQSLQTISMVVFLLLASLLLLAVYIIRSTRHKRRLVERDLDFARQQEAISRQNEQIAIQEKLDLLKNKELETNYARLVGQDEMQKKIGQELHDSVGAMLASVKLNLSPVDEVLDQLPEDNRRQYATANRLLSEASEEVRRISHQLSSAVLQKFGLKAQLEALAGIIPDSGKLQVELATHGLKERLDYQTELQIYRMVQELVHNVIKHAQAKNITIQVNRFEHNINVIVEDDGRGFEVEKMPQSSGMGMQNLNARVHDLNGKLTVDSRPGRGTTVSIDIPLKS